MDEEIENTLKEVKRKKKKKKKKKKRKKKKKKGKKNTKSNFWLRYGLLFLILGGYIVYTVYMFRPTISVTKNIPKKSYLRHDSEYNTTSTPIAADDPQLQKIQQKLFDSMRNHLVLCHYHLQKDDDEEYRQVCALRSDKGKNVVFIRNPTITGKSRQKQQASSLKSVACTIDEFVFHPKIMLEWDDGDMFAIFRNAHAALLQLVILEFSLQVSC